MGRYRETWGRYGLTARQAGPLARLAPSSMVLIGIAASPSTLAACIAKPKGARCLPSEIHSQCSGGVSPSTSPAVMPSTGGDATRLVRVGVGVRVRASVRVRGGVGSRVRVRGRDRGRVTA